MLVTNHVSGFYYFIAISAIMKKLSNAVWILSVSKGLILKYDIAGLSDRPLEFLLIKLKSFDSFNIFWIDFYKQMLY